MASEFGGDPVEVAVGAFDSIELSNFVLVFVGVLEAVVPSAFEDLIGFLDHEGPFPFGEPFFKDEGAVLHLLFARFPGEAKADGFLEIRFAVFEEVNRAFASLQEVLRGVGAVAAL